MTGPRHLLRCTAGAALFAAVACQPAPRAASAAAGRADARVPATDAAAIITPEVLRERVARRAALTEVQR
jgi:hypothetical protein